MKVTRNNLNEFCLVQSEESKKKMKEENGLVEYLLWKGFNEAIKKVQEEFELL